MRDKIIELEGKIQEDKKLLDAMSKTVYEGYSYSSDFIKAKLNNMEAEIEYMEQQIIILKRDVEAMSVAPVSENQEEQPSAVSGEKTTEVNMQANISDGWNDKQADDVQNSMHVKPYNISFQELPRKDMEAAVGKTIMGVAASILIFISFVLFATLIIPHLTDGIRLTLMYIVSIGITVFGLFKLNKAKDSVLFLSVSACGVGSIFISLFLSNIYFNIFNEIVLYLLLLCWAAGVCVLSKLRSGVFNVIGQIGILISVFFGVIFCGDADEINKMFMIVVYFIVGSLIFYFTHCDSKKVYIANNVFNLISTFILSIGLVDLNWFYEVNERIAPDIYYVAFGALMAYSLFFMILPLLWGGNDGNESFSLLQKHADATGILSAAYYFAFSISLDGLVSDDWFYGITLIVAPIYLFVVEYIRRKYTESAGINVLYVFLTVMIANSMDSIYYLYLIFGLALLIIPYILYGFLCNKRIFKIMALVLMLAFAVDDSVNIVMWIVLGIIIFGGAVWLAIRRTEYYKPYYKNIILGFSIIFVLNFMDCLNYKIFSNYYQDMSCHLIECITFVIISIIVAFAAKSVFIKNPVTGMVEKGTKIYTDILVAILMVAGIENILYVDYVLPQILYIIFTIGLFMLNAFEQIKNRENNVYGAYVGLKFTVLMVVILSSFNAENFLISIFCFLFAIVSIVVGFAIKHKTLRIYGLVLSLISVVKLVMIDITYDNTLGHALSFFVSGVLCFVISAIYTGVEKKMKNI